MRAIHSLLSSLLMHRSRSASLTSPTFPLLAISPSLSTTGHMPENLDHVVSGSVIDNIINLFFDYVSGSFLTRELADARCIP